MPIYECDAWREQYFEGIDCPADVHIATDDVDACRFNPHHRWIYDKTVIARSQGLDWGLHDTEPPQYPVFCKPITNLKGMGVGSCVLHDRRDFQEKCSVGRFWMTLLTGEHVSSDFAVVDGQALWHRQTLGIPAAHGTFDYWVVRARADPALQHYCTEWIRRLLPDYTGMLNVETVGGRIIEVHLRFADQWPDLYGTGWLDAMVRLYQHREWRFCEPDPTDGYSVVLFGPHGRQYDYPAPGALAAYRADPRISSLQITFSAGLPNAGHVMPPGGFRLAVINSLDFDAALRLRSRLAEDFGV
jgi:hypothetical protein